MYLRTLRVTTLITKYSKLNRSNPNLLAINKSINSLNLKKNMKKQRSKVPTKVLVLEGQLPKLLSQKLKEILRTTL